MESEFLEIIRIVLLNKTPNKVSKFWEEFTHFVIFNMFVFLLLYVLTGFSTFANICEKLMSVLHSGLKFTFWMIVPLH